LSLDIVKLGSPIFFDHTAVNPSGFSQDYVETPKFWVFRDAETTGVAASVAGANLAFRTGFQGHYYGNFAASTGNGFTSASYYNVIVSGKTVGNGFTGTVFSNPMTFYIEENSFDTLALAAANVYFADVSLDRDAVSQTDEYTAVWYRNGSPASGYSLGTLRVVKRDGTDLINVAMTGIGTGVLAMKYDATGSNNLIIDGESYIALVTAYIDAAVRTGAKVISRDNSVG
jgi:hypothetical protein